MKTRPILCSAPMVQALLEGRKTQTRRIVKPQPNGGPQAEMINLGGAWGLLDGILSGEWCCPYGQPGDLLYVKETVGKFDGREPDAYEGRYAADGEEAFDGWYWKRPLLPSIHMPRWASRLTLRITDVRVERLQDISEDDAYAEGVTHAEWGGMNAREGFRRLWESIYGTGSWDANPWVWVISFDVIQQNVDDMIVGVRG